MVTARQPYLFTKELEIGPAKQQQTHDAILGKGQTCRVITHSHTLSEHQVGGENVFAFLFVLSVHQHLTLSLSCVQRYLCVYRKPS
jgi:hypothetical protein